MSLNCNFHFLQKQFKVVQFTTTYVVVEFQLRYDVSGLENVHMMRYLKQNGTISATIDSFYQQYFIKMHHQISPSPTHYSRPRKISINSKDQYLRPQDNSGGYNTLYISHSQNHLNNRQLSQRSVSTHRKSRISKISQPTAYDNDFDHSRISQVAVTNYENIERILKNQNGNLQKQNQLLMAQINRLKGQNKKYKQTCLSQRIQIQALREESEAHKQRADQMKEIILNRLVSLESKALGATQGLTRQQRQGLLQALSLNLSQSCNQIQQ